MSSPSHQALLVASKDVSSETQKRKNLSVTILGMPGQRQASKPRVQLPCTPHPHFTHTQGAFDSPVFPSRESETPLHWKHLPTLENIACVQVMYMLLFVWPQCDHRLK
ncbi:unnamed protein product [Ixodes pacificus]